MIKLYLSCLLVLSCTSLMAQNAEPVKNKSNRIILHFNDTSGLFTKLAKTLIDIGYELEEKDRELGVLKTKPTDQPGGWTFKNEIKAIFRDSIITLSDVMHSGGYKIDLFYVTKKYITHYKAWNHIMEIANSLKPDQITYAEQK